MCIISIISLSNQKLNLLLSTIAKEGSVRLVKKFTPASLTGNPQVFFNNNWAEVCSDTVTIKDMQVICRQLGYKFASSTANNGTSNHIPKYNLRCAGDEQSITECNHQLLPNPNDCSNHSLQITCTGNDSISLCC